MRWLEKYIWFDECAGVELQALGNNMYNCRICIISLKKQQLSIDHYSEINGDLQSIIKKLPTDKPIAFALTGKGVLVKQTSKLEELSRDNLEQVFPNLDIPQFYIQNFISGDNSFISIIRKEITDTLISIINQNGSNILSLSLGPFVTHHILKQLNSYGDQVQFDGHFIELRKDLWSKYTYNPSYKAQFPVKIDIEAIDEKYVLAYATAFQLLLHQRLTPINLSVSALQQNLTRYANNKKFNFAGRLILGSFFILLLLNFIVYSWYQAKNLELSSQVTISTAGTDSIRKMNLYIKRNENQLKDLGWNGGTSYAWLCDQIGQSIPSAIKLDQLIIHPIKEEKLNNGNPPILETGLVKIEGHCPDIRAVNEWIYLLREKKWVEEVKMKSFSHAEQPEDDSAQNFVLLLKY